MIESWLQPVERIILSSIKGGQRTVAMVSPREDAGVSSLTQMMAETLARSERKVLLIDLTATIDAAWHDTDHDVASDASEAAQSSDETQEAGEPAADAIRIETAGVTATDSETSDVEASPPAPATPWSPGTTPAADSIWADKRGFDCLVARPTDATRFHFNAVERLRAVLDEELAHYDAIILDLPPVLSGSARRINAIAAAAACDAALLVCLTGRLSESQIGVAMELLADGGVALIGTVLNDRDAPTLGTEIAREGRKIGRFLPSFGRWIERRASASTFLNS